MVPRCYDSQVTPQQEVTTNSHTVTGALRFFSKKRTFLVVLLYENRVDPSGPEWTGRARFWRPTEGDSGPSRFLVENPKPTWAGRDY